MILEVVVGAAVSEDIIIAVVSEGISVTQTTEGVAVAFVPKGVIFNIRVERIIIAVFPEGVREATGTEETVIIKSLFIGTYIILLNNIRINIIRSIQRRICK